MPSDNLISGQRAVVGWHPISYDSFVAYTAEDFIDVLPRLEKGPTELIRWNMAKQLISTNQQ